MNLKVGLLNNVDIQFVFTPYGHVETRDSGTRTIASGFSDDTQVRLKINLWGNDGGSTAFAIMPFVKVPTGARGLTNNHVEGGLILPLAFDLPSDFSLGTMVEFDLVYDDDRRNYGFDVVHTATLGHPIIGHLSGYIEYVGNVPRIGSYRAIASGGLSYQLAKNWVVDSGGTLGLAGAVDDMTVFVGTSLRF
ncbi:transporter [uncultured Sphingomonas sp.]|uniref:transporter n=1 Tax=uncultured Sphingomonas sp. TaxID=158754 RepID=UPI0035CB4799